MHGPHKDHDVQGLRVCGARLSRFPLEVDGGDEEHARVELHDQEGEGVDAREEGPRGRAISGVIEGTKRLGINVDA